MIMIMKISNKVMILMIMIMKYNDNDSNVIMNA